MDLPPATYDAPQDGKMLQLQPQQGQQIQVREMMGGMTPGMTSGMGPGMSPALFGGGMAHCGPPQPHSLALRHMLPPGPPPKEKKSGLCCTITLMGLITCCLLAIFGLLLKKHIYFEEALEDYVDISHITLDSNNYNKVPDVAAGTIIITAKDGSKGIIEDNSFSIMAVSL